MLKYFFDEFPKKFDKIQIRAVRRQIYQFDTKLLGPHFDSIAYLILGIVE